MRKTQHHIVIQFWNEDCTRITSTWRDEIRCNGDTAHEAVEQAKEWLTNQENKARKVFCLHYHMDYTYRPASRLLPEGYTGDGCPKNDYVARVITIGELEKAIH
jgi:hypothetical protein